MQDKPHRRLNLTQPYGQANGATLTAPENGNGHPHEPETPEPLAAVHAAEPVTKVSEGRPAYLVVPLDSAQEPLASAFRATPSTAASAAPPAAPAARGWLLPTLGGVVLGALVVGAVAFRGNLFRPAAPIAAPRTAKAKAAHPAPVRPVVSADADGSLLLQGGQATLHGKKIRQTSDSVGYWDGSDCYVTWAVDVPRAGNYAAALTLSVGDKGGEPFVVQAGSSRIESRSPSTGSWTTNRTVALGTLTLPKGRTTVAVRPNGKLTTPLMVLRTLRLAPASVAKGEIPTGK